MINTAFIIVILLLLCVKLNLKKNKGFYKQKEVGVSMTYV